MKEKLPGVVGVPLNTPPEERVKLFGIPVAGAFHVYGGVPPVAVSDKVYALPRTPAGSRAGVVMFTVPVAGPVTTTIRKSAVAVWVGLPDCAWTVKSNVPPVVGVPDIPPFVLNERPGGRTPLITDQVACTFALSVCR